MVDSLWQMYVNVGLNIAVPHRCHGFVDREAKGRFRNEKKITWHVTSDFRKDLKCWGHFENIRIPSVTKTHWKSAITTDFTASQSLGRYFFSGNMCKNAHGEPWMPFDGGVDISNENGPKYVDITDIHLWCSYQSKHEIACHQPTHPWCFYHGCFFCGKHIISSITFFSSSKGNCLYFHFHPSFPTNWRQRSKTNKKHRSFLKPKPWAAKSEADFLGGILIHYELVWIKLNQTNFRIIPHITGEG